VIQDWEWEMSQGNGKTEIPTHVSSAYFSALLLLFGTRLKSPSSSSRKEMHRTFPMSSPHLVQFVSRPAESVGRGSVLGKKRKKDDEKSREQTCFKLSRRLFDFAHIWCEV